MAASYAQGGMAQAQAQMQGLQQAQTLQQQQQQQLLKKQQQQQRIEQAARNQSIAVGLK